MLYKTQHIINNNLINLSYNTLETTIKYIPQKPIEKKPKYDKNDDFLFWIFFIFVKGEMEFEYIKKQKYKIMIKNIIFDFDGVLVDSEVLASKAFSKYFSKFDKSIKEEQFYKYEQITKNNN